MAKGKAKAKVTSVTNRPLYSRMCYLYQAATYLSTQSQKLSQPAQVTKNSLHPTIPSTKMPIGSSSASSSRHLLSELEAVSHKSQIRISPTMKHTICKRCHTLLHDDSTCSTRLENKSKGGKKQWADVLVRTCKNCNLQQRTPVGARQKRRPHRSSDTQVLQTHQMSLVAKQDVYARCMASKLSPFHGCKTERQLLSTAAFQNREYSNPHIPELLDSAYVFAHIL